MFLSWRFGRRDLRLRALRPKDLLRYVSLRAQTLKAGIRDVTVGLRSFLRFLEFTGHIRPGLVLAVPHPAIPHGFPPPEVLAEPARRKFLHSFDRTNAVGRRDFAIALCLSELALRANEVASLTLDDVDWRNLTLRLRQTKQGRERLVPLPAHVAKALANYLERGRPAASHRDLFVRHRAPFGQPLQGPHVRVIIRRAFIRSGLDCSGAYILRHSWATRAHRQGTHLKLIADILGHRSLNTTTRYAQVHVEELRQAAQPWPRTKP
jgi:integrase